MEDVVKSVARKLLGSSGPGGTDSEGLQVWTIKSGKDTKTLCTIVETFVDWIANKSPTWEAYREFMSGCMIEPEKRPGVCPVGIGKTPPMSVMIMMTISVSV